MFARKSRAPQPSQRPTKPASLQPVASEASANPREQIAALHIDAIGALNSVIGLSSLLAGDGRVEEREAGRAQRYGKHIRAAGEVLQGIVGRMVAVTSDAFDGGPASLPGAPVLGPCSSPRLKVLPVRPSEPLDEFERLSVTPAADLTAPLPRVLVVDADPGGRELLRAYLHGRPYEVLLATSAQEALLLAAVTPPDLVLLDAMLPHGGANMAARRLKESAHGEYLPIIFMTAYGDGDARIEALDAGAEQFLEKPLSVHEVRSRVGNLLTLRAERNALTAQNQRLQRLQAFKEETTALIIHDLKGPLSAITANLEVALQQLGEIENAGTVDGGLTSEIRGALEDSRQSGARLFRMIANLLDVARNDEGRLVPRPTPTEAEVFLGRLAHERSAEARVRGINLTCEVATGLQMAVDQDLIGRVLENLLDNALRYTRRHGHIRIAAMATGENGEDVELVLANDGAPIAHDLRPRIFEKYEQGTGAGGTVHSRGLGLYFCRLATEAHGGKISLEEEEAFTTVFRLRLPKTARVVPAPVTP